MTVYREEMPRSRLPLLIGGGLVALFVIGFIVFALRPADTPAPAGAKSNFLPTLNTISLNLDVFVTEYAKVKQGTPANQTSAPDAAQRALKALIEQRPLLSTLDDEALANLERDLNTLAAALSKNPVPDQEATIKDVQKQLTTLQDAMNRRK